MESQMNRRRFLGAAASAGVTLTASGRVLGANEKVVVGVMGTGGRRIRGDVLVTLDLDASVLFLVARYVDRQKRELLEYLWESGACDAEHAVYLSGVDVRPSILRSMISRNVVKRTETGRYYLDPSRVHEAYGASNGFILYAMGAFLLAFLVIMLW